MAKRRSNGEGTVRRRPDGRWEGRIIAGHKDNGKPIYRSVFAPTQKELTEKLRVLIRQYQGVELGENSRVTLGEWLDIWLRRKEKSLRESTAELYRSTIRHHIVPHLGTKMLSQITPIHLQSLYATLLQSGRVSGGGLSNATVRKVHMLLHEAFADAVREKRLAENPTLDAVPPKVERKEMPVLQREQIEKLLAQTNGDALWHDFFTTELMTGLRRGEICALRWEDYSEDGCLHVCRSVRCKSGRPILGEPKTDGGKRTILLPMSVKNLMDKRKETAVSDWIFPHPKDDSMPLPPSSAYHKLKSLLRKAGLPDMRFHDLRHTFSTTAAAAGVDPKTLPALLGHTKASFSLDVYTSMTDDMKVHAQTVVGNFITDVFGKELKPWQEEEKRAKEV